MNQTTPNKTNVALRLHVIFSKIEKMPGNSMIDTWHQIFFRTEEDPIKKWAEAARIATKVYEEISSLENTLQKIIPADDYHSEIHGMKTITSIQYLGYSYVSLRGNLPDGFLRVLKGYSREIGYNENSVPEHQFELIRSSLDDLKNNLASSLHNETLAAVLKKYILMIESALIDYEIIGSEAFSAVYKQAILVTIENQVTLKENKDCAAVRSAGKILEKIKETFEIINQGSEIFRIGQEVLAKITI